MRYNGSKENMMLIERPDYINRLKTFRDQSLVKVLVGMRRSGKSTLFRLFVDYLKSTGVKDEDRKSVV